MPKNFKYKVRRYTNGWPEYGTRINDWQTYGEGSEE